MGGSAGMSSGSTNTWQVAQDSDPPHSATMPGTPLRTAVSMTESPGLPSTVRLAPVCSVYVICGIGGSPRRRKSVGGVSDELPAAVDDERLAGYECAVGSGEEEGGAHDVLGPAGAPQGAALHAVLLGVLDQAVAGLCEREAGGDGVDGDRPPAQF